MSSIRLFFQKYTRREFRPGYIFDIPVYVYRIYLSIKARSLSFFSNINPGMHLSGFAGYRKSNDIKRFDPILTPKTIVCDPKMSRQEFTTMMQKAKISYPCIAKPDLWRTGRDVKKIFNDTELLHYTQTIKEGFVIQEFIDYPLEFGVFYYRMPDEEKGHITGIVEKKFMFIDGEGDKTLGQLVGEHPRAKYYHKSLKQTYQKTRDKAPELGEKIQLNYIGNHCRGSTFYDASHLISPQLEETIDKISKTIPGFYFGRYDIKTKSIQDMEEGNMKILELNGMGSLPTHIYDPQTSIWKAYRTTFQHRDIAYKISMINWKNGIKYIPTKKTIALIREYGW